MIDQLADAVLDGHERSIARAISIVENESAETAHLIGRIFPHTGNSKVIGLTGPPGAGKSTMTDRIVSSLVEQGKRVGVIAIDPTSPFSGGAILGDRIRMRSLTGLPGVFVRSMATRGALGGLNQACIDVVDILDASGMDVILIETVGVGQDEVDIIRVSDLNVVVLIPGMGDDIQAMKAGLMEIADLFVINKADQDGVQRLKSQLDYLNMLSGLEIPIIETIATDGTGIQQLVNAITTAQADGTRREKLSEHRSRRARFRIQRVLQSRLLQSALDAFGEEPFEHLQSEIARRETDPYSAAEQIMSVWLEKKHEIG